MPNTGTPSPICAPEPVPVMTPCSVYAAVAATASLIAGWQVICGVMSLPCASIALSIAFEGHRVPLAATEA